MRTTLLKWGLPVIGLLLATGCKSNEEPQTPTTTTEQVLTFRSQLKDVSRASDTSFETGDCISLFAVRPNGDESSVFLNDTGNHFDNLLYTYNGANFVSDPEYYKVNDQELAYFAIYPYSEDNGANFTFTVKADQRESCDYTASDLCTASTGYTTEANPMLTFSHRLSSLVVNLEGNHLAGEVTVKINNVATSTQCDLNNLTFTAVTDSEGTIMCNEYGTNAYRAILAPQTISANAQFLTIWVNDKEYNLALDNTLVLSSGKQTTLSVRVVNEELVLYSGDIYPWNTEAQIEYVVPDEILDRLEEYITINRGINPPNIEGCYLVEPFVSVFCEDQANGGYEPGTQVASHFMNFANQNQANLTVDFSEVSALGSYSTGNGAFISGESNNFSVFFSTEGNSHDIYTKQALVISGTKTTQGIKNLEYAFVMVDKGDDPENKLMAKGVFRVFKDEDGMSVNSTWPGLPNERAADNPLSFNTLRSYKKIIK